MARGAGCHLSKRRDDTAIAGIVMMRSLVDASPFHPDFDQEQDHK
jgi:hypothetical protein